MHVAPLHRYPYTSGKTGKTGKCKKGVATAGGDIAGYTWATKSCPEGSKCKSQDEVSTATIDCVYYYYDE
jgi:hypothetical protein